MKLSIAVVFVMCGLAAVTAVPQESRRTDKEPEKAGSRQEQSGERVVDADTWMKAKQRYAQRIFAGLTEGDFERMEGAARMMVGVNVLEKWLADRDDFESDLSYQGQLNAFEYSTKEIWRFAKQKDIEGALAAYVMLSESCVRCHNLVRDSVAPSDIE